MRGINEQLFPSKPERKRKESNQTMRLKRLTLHELKKKVPFALAFLSVVTTSSLKNTGGISTQRFVSTWRISRTDICMDRHPKKTRRGKKSASQIAGRKVWIGGKRTKVNATVLGTVHWVITPVVLLSKGMALARDRQQESKRAIKTVRWNMAREEGGRNESRKYDSLRIVPSLPWCHIPELIRLKHSETSRLYSGIIKDPRYRRFGSVGCCFEQI